MGHKFVQYEDDEEDKWAIWSTVTDSFIVYNATAEEVVEYEAQQAYDKQKEKSQEHVEAIQNGEDPYRGGDLMTEEDIKEIKEESE